MINVANTIYAGMIQRTNTHIIPKNLAEGQSLQAAGQDPCFDNLELSDEAASRSALLNMPSELELDKPRAWSISIETLDSRISHMESSIKKADSLNLSFGDRLTFLRDEGKKWVEGIRQSDPEMFEQWLKMNKDNIETGRPDLASLPSDFTIKDYHSYVKEPFSVLV